MIPFGEAYPFAVPEQGMVRVHGRGQTENCLQGTVDGSACHEIPSSCDEVDTLLGVIDNYGQVITRGSVLAGEDDVFTIRWNTASDTGVKIFPCGTAYEILHPLHIDAPGMRFSVS